ncbi:putative membrane protein [Pontibacter virosus]|uniref:Putative membrane protein n=2 Tax=Pontibacter virosus TaxID=1765052 RepID=A0A2U1B5L7_9BACT|nr:putative membrane protein [Pontibacter virosus]
MGAADVVPGVSGGTIAFISGIYEELLDSIRSVDGEALRLISKFDIKGFWQHINGNFLLVLLAGIFTSIVTLSNLVVFLLATYPIMVWGFFFGLIVASVVVVSKKITRWRPATVLFGLIGVALAYYITVAVPMQTPEAHWFVFIAGAIAICAMILPGISGSFLLLLMAKYEFIMNALKEFKIDIILVFGVGCVTGLLAFSHVLNWMLTKYHNITVALLTGFMLGSLNKVWPWKKTLETYTDRHGEVKPLLQENILPGHYAQLTGESSYLLYTVLLAAFGFLLVYLLDRMADQPAGKV